SNLRNTACLLDPIEDPSRSPLMSAVSVHAIFHKIWNFNRRLSVIHRFDDKQEHKKSPEHIITISIACHFTIQLARLSIIFKHLERLKNNAVILITLQNDIKNMKNSYNFN
ncbi:MAG: hypothetical protein JAY67_21440, partial [Candidatus Thiodiazotropha taylori]|nr:hypothetical protein [Candidatus Thiodiazotropha taylori]